MKKYMNKDENFNENIGTFKLMPVFNNKYVKENNNPRINIIQELNNNVLIFNPNCSNCNVCVIYVQEKLQQKKNQYHLECLITTKKK